MSLMKRMEDGFVLQPRMTQIMDRLFDDSLNQMKTRGGFVPPVDVLEDEKQYEIHVAVPGVKKEDFQIEFQRNQLSVAGERKEIKKTETTKLHRVESFQGKFRRVFTIPENVDQSKIEASYEDGMLKVVMPKDEAANQKTSISVK